METKRIRIDAFAYTVDYVDQRISMNPLDNGSSDAPQALGMTESYLKKITISTLDCCKQTQLQTLMHEIMHAIQNERMLPEFNGKRNEELIEGFANGVLQVMMDNPWLMKSIVQIASERR